MPHGISIASFKAFFKAPTHTIMLYVGATFVVLAIIGSLLLPPGLLIGLWIAGPVLVLISIFIYSKKPNGLLVTVTQKSRVDVNVAVRIVVVIIISLLFIAIWPIIRHFLLHKPILPLQNWAFFGSYFSGTIGPIFVLGNFIVTLLVFWWLNHHRFRESTAFDLYKDWWSEQMFDSRIKAWQFTLKFPQADLDTFYKDRDRRFTQHLDKVWVVMAFFQRLHVDLEQGRIEKELLVSLFGPIFTWWYVVCFNHNLCDPSWGGAYRLVDLWKIISEEAKKTDQYNVWLDQAWEDLTHHIEQEKTDSQRQDYPRHPVDKSAYTQ